MGTNLTESKPNAQLEVYIFMEERRLGQSWMSTFFQLNSSYCKLY